MRALRTPDDRFENLPGWTFAPSYTEVPDGDGGALRVHHVDEGPAGANPILCMHGEPSWAYLYRKMIPVLHRRGLPRGRSRSGRVRPQRQADRARRLHLPTPRRLDDGVAARSRPAARDPRRVRTGARSSACGCVAENPDRFDRVVVANGFLPTGDAAPGDAFLRWREYSQTTPNFHVGGIVKGGCRTELSEDVIAAYDAPFPDDTYKAGARKFPVLVPISPDDPASAPEQGGVDRAREVGEARAHRVQRSGPDHARRRPCVPVAECPARRASRTRRSRAAGTSCRRTRARSWRTSSWSWLAGT